MPTPTKQLLSRTLYTGDGVTTAWNFTFSSGYLDKAHVKAYTQSPAGVRTDLTVLPGDFLGKFQLQIVPAVVNGHKLTIYRDTPKDAPLVDFADGSAFQETTLDTLAKQAVFVAAESYDALNLVVGPEFQATAEKVALDAAAAASALLSALAAQAAAQAAAATAAADAVTAAGPLLLAAVQPAIGTTSANATAAANSAIAAAASAAGVPSAVATAMVPYITTAVNAATAAEAHKLAAAASASAASGYAANAASAATTVQTIAGAFTGTFGFTTAAYDFGFVTDTTTYLDLDCGALP